MTFTATVGGATSGTVTFRDGSVALGSATLNGSGQATYTAATLSGGSVSGVVAGESVTVIPGTGTFDSANAGLRAVTATGYSLGGANAGNYFLSAQPTVPNATITPRLVQLTGTRPYDKTTLATGVLSAQNNLDGPDLTLTGSANLAGPDVGQQAVSTAIAASRVQFAKGNTGSNAMTSFNVTLGSAPGSGNTLVAVISIRSSSTNTVSSITQTGASWSRVCQAANSNGTATEIWTAPNVSGAGTMITISQASLRSAAVVMEYNGVLTASPLDQTATATNSQPDELWIGGIGFISSTPTLTSPLNGFSAVTNAQSTRNTSSSNAKVYALEKIVNSAAPASSGGTLSSTAQWSGAIATFRTQTPTTLALSGPAADNYTLAGAGGSVLVTPRPVTVAAVTASKTYDGTTYAAGTPTLSQALIPGDTALSLSQAFQNSSAALGNKVIIPSIAIDDGNTGNNHAVTWVNDNTGTITPAPATISLTDLSQTYDGKPKPVTTTTDPVSLAVSITYDGSPTPPTAAGTYAVAATITDANHEGTATGSLVIALTNDLTFWRASNFTETEQLAGLAGESADPDGDGWSNLAEYAMGCDPHQFSPPLVPVRDENGLSLTFTRPAGLPGITYQAESTEDFQTWIPLPLELLTPGATETLRARDPLDTGDPSRRYLRLRFERQ